MTKNLKWTVRVVSGKSCQDYKVNTRKEAYVLSTTFTRNEGNRTVRLCDDRIQRFFLMYTVGKPE